MNTIHVILNQFPKLQQLDIDLPKDRSRMAFNRLSVTIRDTARYGSWVDIATLLEGLVEQHGETITSWSKGAYSALWWLHRALIRRFRQWGHTLLYWGSAVWEAEDNEGNLLYQYKGGGVKADKLPTHTESSQYSDGHFASEYAYQCYVKGIEAERATRAALGESIYVSTDVLLQHHHIMYRSLWGVIEALQTCAKPWLRAVYNELYPTFYTVNTENDEEEGDDYDDDHYVEDEEGEE